MSKNNPLSVRLAKLAKGALLPSETDSPLTVVEYPNAAAALGDAKAFRKLVGAAPRTAAEKSDAAAFLNKFGKPSDSDAAAVKKMKAKFADLAAFFAAELPGAVVWRLGKISVQVYIVGPTSSGDVVGLQGTMVET